MDENKLNSNDELKTELEKDPQQTEYDRNEKGSFTSQNESIKMPETPAQFYEQYKKKMSDLYEIPDNMDQMQANIHKKRSKKPITVLFILLLILGTCATAYAFRNTIINTVTLLTKSPVAYYSQVEKDALQTTTAYLDLMMNKDNIAQHASADIKINREALRPLLKKYGQIEDIEKELGISIKNFGFDMDVARDKNTIYEKISMTINKVNVLSTDIFMDNLKQETIYRIPELSPAYIRMTQANGKLGNPATKIIISQLTNPEEATDFIKRYGNLLIDQIKNVRIEKNATLKLGDNSVKCNKLTASLDGKELNDCVSTILKTAKEDKKLLDQLSSLSISKDEYIKSIDQGLKIVSEDKNYTEKIEMNVYVDLHGKIIGRELKIIDNGESKEVLSYKLITKNNKGEFSFQLNDKKNDGVTVSGNYQKSDRTYNGAITMNVTTSEKTTMSLAYHNVRFAYKNHMPYMYGNYKISSPALDGVELTADCDVENDTQLFKMNLLKDQTSLFLVNMKSNPIKNYTIPKLSSSDKVYDISDLESYYDTMDIKKYLTDLTKKLGMKQDVINALLPFLFNSETSKYNIY